MEKGYELKVLDHGYVRLIDWMGDDKRITEAARISYKSPSKGDEADKKLLNYLWKHRHTSPFEQVKVAFNIKLPIFVMRDYVRHRMQNLNEMSGRYTQLPNEFYIPDKWRIQDTKNKQGSIVISDEAALHSLASDVLMAHCKKSYELYELLLGQNVAKELARMILPVNIYTEIYCCWDLKNLMHFFSLRDHEAAQFEIQEYARAMMLITKALFPWTLEAYEKYKWKLTEI